MTRLIRYLIDMIAFMRLSPAQRQALVKQAQAAQPKAKPQPKPISRWPEYRTVRLGNGYWQIAEVAAC